jgi:hypothetical protein
MFANHFLVQHQLNEFVVTLGQVTGPPVVGSPARPRSHRRLLVTDFLAIVERRAAREAMA